MVGRDAELAELQRAFLTAGQTVVVRGGAGLGKSRLLREFATWARGAGGTVVVGRCSPAAADVPFRPLREALLAAARTGLRPSSRLAPFLPALGSLVPEWSQTRDPGSDSGSIVLAEGLLRLLTEWSAAGVPAVLAIEDMHWSDRETVKAIEYLADNLAGHPVLVIATLRDREPGAGTDLIDALLARRAIHPVDLEPLDPAQAVLMLRECPSPITLPPNLIDVIVSRSDGIPFFIEEILATTVENSMSEGIVPSSISVAIDTRLASLPGATAEFLRYAAMLGRQFDWHVVAAALGCPPQDAIDRLRQAARTQLVDAGGGAFRFRHALTVEVVQSSLLPEERRAVCAGLLAALQTLHPDLEGETCLLAAGLAGGAGDRGRSAELWLEAARRAIAAGWLGAAEELARRAQADRPIEAERVLLKTWALAGQPLRAVEAARRILSSGADPELARRPYDLRHAALSLWLTASGAPAEVAVRAGSSARVLHDVYLHCIGGQEDTVSQRIENALAVDASVASSSRCVKASGAAHRRPRPRPVIYMSVHTGIQAAHGTDSHGHCPQNRLT